MRGSKLSCIMWRRGTSQSCLVGISNTEVSHSSRRPCRGYHQVSKMYQPSHVLPQGTRQEELSCKSQRLMIENGLIRQAGAGTFHLLPLAQRALEKLIRVIDSEMRPVGGQKITMPSLCSSSLWKKSGRWEQMGTELFRLIDRHNTRLCLGPTHEEAVTDIIAAEGTMSYKRFPIKLYQITTKFRDEPRPRFGLLRGREFIMKDMYTFDSSAEAAVDTYQSVCEAYTRLFQRLKLDCVRVVGDTGSIGGSLSHEYHFPAQIGEDELFNCKICGLGANGETTEGSRPPCQRGLSESACQIRLQRGIEVGHAFLLGTKYSKIFNASYQDPIGSISKKFTEMGCYGLGVTRILAASIEVLSTEQEIQWPSLIAPYQVYVIPPKRKSKEEAAIPLADKLCNDIVHTFPRLQDELLLDDRDHMTIGRRLTDAKKLGYPYVIILAKRALEEQPLYELHTTHQGTIEYLTKSELLKTIAAIDVV